LLGKLVTLAARLRTEPCRDPGVVGRRLGRWLDRNSAADKLFIVEIRTDATGAACRQAPAARGAATAAHQIRRFTRRPQSGSRILQQRLGGQGATSVRRTHDHRLTSLQFSGRIQPLMPKRAVLLVNLGSPDSTAVPDVKRYLTEFLGDERVIDKPDNPFLRSILVNQLIIPKRVRNSAHAYEQVWTKEGSPLLVVSQRVRDKLATALGPDTPVYLAMRYGHPSIASVITKIAAEGVDELLLFPQYPHYAMSSWETVVVRVMAEAVRQAPRLRVSMVQPFYADPDYVEVLQTVAAPYLAQPHDYVLFSYHGLPERHMRKADSSRGHCLTVPECCDTCVPAHATCYRAQCFATTRALVARAGIPAAKHSISFQSRLGGEPWLSPYTDYEFKRLPSVGVKTLLVLSPAFTADCLETLEELQQQGRDTFIGAGGLSFQQIPCPNDHPAFIDFLAKRVEHWLTRRRV
jgi:protoporphyrin/coproporphyrin ferrochelatase